MNDAAPFDITKVKETALKVIQQPVAFYREMPKTGGLTDPIIFLVVMAVLSGVILSILALFGGGRLASMGFVTIIMMPIMMLIWSFISAAIMYVIWRLMGSAENYETAYRCIAFASAIMPVMAVVSIMPYISSVIGVLWGSFLMFTASTEVHKIDRKKATIVFAVLAVIGIIMNLSGEMASRQMQSRMVNFDENVGRMIEDMDEMSPEEAGRAVGEFVRGLEEAAEGR